MSNKSNSTKQDAINMQPDDPMSEAGRKVLAYHFAKLVDNEEGTREGEDIEALHDMRVATRRMRAAFAVFAPYYKKSATKRLLKELRQTGRTLGAVRDLDVMIDKAKKYGEDHPEQGSLEPLLQDWDKQREKARKRMVKYLDSKDYRRFIADFDRFTGTPGRSACSFDASAPKPYLVRQTLPAIVWEHFGDVRAYELVLDTAPLPVLHQWRIEFKRLRYTLEFFEEVLGPDIAGVIKKCVTMQDHLGDLHDTDVLITQIADFLRNAAQSGDDLNGVRNYGAAQLADEKRLHETLPAAWRSFNTPELRMKIGQAVARL